MALRLFCTFIDVEEAEKDSVPTRRSRSQPCPRGSANAALDGESEYVATLLERSEATDFRALLTVQDAAEGEEAQTETGPPPVDPPDELGSSTSADEVAPSLGTVGHPVLCRRPCVRFMKGECTAGAACNYCHLQHEGLIMSLDKRQRQQIQNMDLADLLATLLPSLRAALAELPQRPAARLLAALQAPAAAKAPVHDRMLDRRLRRMSLSALLSCITARHSDFAVALHEHIDELRREMPVADVQRRTRSGTV